MGSVFKQASLRDNFPLTASVLTCSVCCRVIIQPALGLVFFALFSCCVHLPRPVSHVVATATCLNPQQADFLAFTCASPTMHCTSRLQCTKECRYTCFFFVLQKPIMFITTWLWLVCICKYPGMRCMYPTDSEKLEEKLSVIIDNYQIGFWEK